MKNYVRFHEALELIKSTPIQTLGTQKVFLHDAVGRSLAQDILAREDSPKCDTSNMDGYAFCYKDFELLQTKGLHISSINKAGNDQECEIESGCCIKTFTGSRMPKGADSLIIVEQVDVRDNKIFFKEESEKLSCGANIRKAGENYKKGDVLLSKGAISPFDIGILAQNNNVFVEVYRKPRITIFTSGDEIMEIGENPTHSNSIYSSNNHVLSAIAESLGAETSLHEILSDSYNRIQSAIAESLQYSDIVLITGGMSKGDFDLTKDIIKEFGQSVFSGVAIKPGKVSAYIKCSEKYGSNKHIIALPGNPASSVVSFALFGRVIMQKMLGIKPHIPIHKATLTQDIICNDTSRLIFGMSDLAVKNGAYEVTLRKNIQSYMVDNFNGALCIVDKKYIKKGELIDIIILNELLKL